MDGDGIISEEELKMAIKKEKSIAAMKYTRKRGGGVLAQAMAAGAPPQCRAQAVTPANCAGMALCEEPKHGHTPHEMADFCGAAAAFGAKCAGGTRAQIAAAAGACAGKAFKTVTHHLTESRLLAQVGVIAAGACGKAGGSMHQMAAAASAAVGKAGGSFQQQRMAAGMAAGAGTEIEALRLSESQHMQQAEPNTVKMTSDPNPVLTWVVG